MHKTVSLDLLVWVEASAHKLLVWHDRKGQVIMSNGDLAKQDKKVSSSSEHHDAAEDHEDD